MKGLHLGDHPGLVIEPNVLQAFTRTLDAWKAPYRGLPVPVRFRASGALRAWLTVLDVLPGMTLVKAALADGDLPPNLAADQLMSAIALQVRVLPQYESTAAPMVAGMVHVSADLLCFWLRQGTLYEPTLPLGSLLGGIDVAADLPLSMVQPPAQTLTILPPWQQRHHCAGMQAISVFCHDATENQAPARRCLTIRASEVVSDEGVTINELVMPIKNEDNPLTDGLSLAMRATLERQEAAGLGGEDLAKLGQVWRDVLDYTVKVLLYLQLDGNRIQPQTPYRDAPKEFPGLGRKKREAKLAEVEKLYDRYLIGPISLADWAGEHANQLGAGGQLSPHWRRGHFRQQAHGPALSLRRLMFIKPTLVRLDRLAEA